MKTKVKLVAFLCGLTFASFGHSQSTVRASVDSLGAQANGNSRGGSLSADGRFVVFSSDATNLITGDHNGMNDIFLRDLQTGVTSRVNVSSSGAGANQDSYGGVISADGSHVAFISLATNLAGNDMNQRYDIFERDLTSGITTRVSVDSNGVEANDLSSWCGLSADGRLCVFSSSATNLVPGVTSGGQIYVHDLQTGATTCASVSSNGTPGNGASFTPWISADGRFVAFSSTATNLDANIAFAHSNVFVRDRVNGTTIVGSVGSNGIHGNSDSGLAPPTLSSDGRFLAFTSTSTDLVGGDTNGVEDVFVRDLQLGVTRRVSVDSAGVQGNALSDGGTLSADGRFVLYHSQASNLVPGDTNGTFDAFVYDLPTGLTTRVDISSSGAQSSALGVGTLTSSISADGRFVAMFSDATNLVSGDTNGDLDVFVGDRQCPTPSIYCTAKVNSSGCTPQIASSGMPSMSAGSGFTISVAQVLNNKSGLIFYGLSGQQAAPFQGGVLCVKTPLKRGPLQDSGGNPPPNDCSGSFSIDFNTLIASGIDPLLVSGTVVDAQYWSRDPGFSSPNNTSLSDALHFGICP